MPTIPIAISNLVVVCLGHGGNTFHHDTPPDPPDWLAILLETRDGVLPCYLLLSRTTDGPYGMYVRLGLAVSSDGGVSGAFFHAMMLCVYLTPV